MNDWFTIDRAEEDTCHLDRQSAEADTDAVGHVDSGEFAEYHVHSRKKCRCDEYLCASENLDVLLCCCVVCIHKKTSFSSLIRQKRRHNVFYFVL